MKSLNIHFIIALLMIAFAAQAGQFGSNCVTNPPDFHRLSYKEADDAVILEENSIRSGFKKICPEYITNLINQIKQGSLSHDNHGLAIDLLAELHSSDSNVIEILIQEIDYERIRFDPPDRFSIQAKYPAMEALIKIGRPVVKPIIVCLPNEPESLRRRLMCEVLRRVTSKDLAQSQIKQKLADESNPAKKINLELALKELEK